MILAIDQRLAKSAVWLIEQQKGIVWQNRRARRLAGAPRAPRAGQTSQGVSTARGAGVPGGVLRAGAGRHRGACAAPTLASCVRRLQQRRHRAAHDDLAGDHLRALDVERAEISADELNRPLV